LARAVHALVPSANPARHVDGLLLTGALLAVESTRHDSLTQVAGTVATVIILLWLSHTYAETVAERLELGRPLTGRQLRRTAAHEMSLLRGAFVPLIVLLVADAIGFSVSASVAAALVSAVVLLFTIEVAAALRAHMDPGAVAVQVGFGMLLAGGVLALHIIA
jgi:hypothetical protein